MRKITQYILIIGIVLIASCQHKELCYDHFHKANVKVLYNWGDSLKNYPESMSMYIYPEDSGAYVRYEFTGHKGGDLKIPYGLYRIMSINSDTDNLDYRGKDSLNKFEVFPKEITYLPGTNMRCSNLPQVKGSESEKFVVNIDSLWSDRILDSVLVKQVWTDTTQIDTIKFAPKLIGKTIRINITEAENLKFATGGVFASLSGLAGGYYPYKEALSSEKVSVLIPLVIGKDGLSLSGVIRTFGDSHKGEQIHNLVVYAIMSDGSKWYQTEDVSIQMHAASGKDEINIKLEGLELPAPLFNGGGILPDVDDWQNMEIPIDM